MNQSVVIGPLALHAGVLVALAAVALGWLAAARAARPGAPRLDGPLYAVAGLGLLAARAAYVVQHGASYAAAPLSMLDLRDGGWSPVAGFVAAALAALLLALRRPSFAKPLLLGVATSAAVWSGAHAAFVLLQGTPARLPALGLRTLDGRVATLEAFKGKPVVLNLWASWCPPCVREMPVLQQAQQQRRDVQFVFVNQGEQPERVQAFLAARGLALDNVLLDGAGQLARALDQRALPTTLFFDARGLLVDTRIGELSAPALAARLAAIAP